MTDFIWPFSPPEKNLWIEKIKKELKQEQHKTRYLNEIEGLDFEITNRTENTAPSNIIGKWNEWFNTASIKIFDEKSANSQALYALNQGADALYFYSDLSAIDWTKVFEGIGLAYIQTTVFLTNPAAISQFSKLNILKKEENLRLEIDALHYRDFIHQKNIHFQLNGFYWQQCGASMRDELAFCLSLGHELMSHHVSPDRISFHTGIGANYFEQMAKLYVWRQQWSEICYAYNSHPTSDVYAHIGWSNKSLKDPYTNLLRQTTEAMSALSGGINFLIVHPYDECTAQYSDAFSQRMALNIGNLLKEESYLDKVLNPLEGSYVLTSLSKQLFEKSWQEFLALDDLTDLDEKLEQMKVAVQQTALKKELVWKNGEMSLIGVNLFPNPFPNEQQKSFLPLSYNGLPFLHFESIALSNEKN